MAQGLVMRRQGQLQNILETARRFPGSSHASALDVSLAPSGLGRSWIVTHGLRRGLHYRAAARLNRWCPEMHRSLGGSRVLRERPRASGSHRSGWDEVVRESKPGRIVRLRSG